MKEIDDGTKTVDFETLSSSLMNAGFNKLDLKWVTLIVQFKTDKSERINYVRLLETLRGAVPSNQAWRYSRCLGRNTEAETRMNAKKEKFC